MASVSPAVTRTATTSPASLHMTNRWSPRLTSWTSPSLSLNASRTKDEIAEIMLPTTSRSLSVIRVRDMCLTRRPLEPITKTSSIMGSGGATGAASAGGGGGGGSGGRPCEREAAAHRQVPADPLSPHLAHGTADRAGELPDIRTHVARRRVWNGEGDREDGVQNRRRRGEEGDAREAAPKLPPLGDDAEGDSGRSRDESQGHEALIVGEDLRHVRLGPPGRQPGELVVRVVAEGRHTGRVVVKRLARAEGPVVPCLPGHRIHPLVLPHGLAEGDQGDGDGYARCGEARPDGHGCKNEAADRLRGLPRGYRL